MKKQIYYITFLLFSINSFSQSLGNFDGVLNNTNVLEKTLDIPAFPNGVSNLAVDFSIGNISFWGYIELEITGTWYYQLTPGKLTKTFAIGVNPNGNIYQNESRVNDALGSIANNIAIGEFKYDAVNNRFVIPISHIVSTMNGYTLKVKAFSHGGGASSMVNTLSISSQYTLAALPRNQVYYNGNVGIGNSNPLTKLHVTQDNGIIRLSGGAYTSVDIIDGGTGDPGYVQTYYYGSLDNQIGAHGTFFAALGGNVGIGTKSPSEKLSVNGNIRAKKLIITQTNWSDYVFAKGYKLRSLTEVENYIKTNQHLPDVPSAKEVVSKGISVGDTQALLLKKLRN